FCQPPVGDCARSHCQRPSRTNTRQQITTSRCPAHHRRLTANRHTNSPYAAPHQPVAARFPRSRSPVPELDRRACDQALGPLSCRVWESQSLGVTEATWDAGDSVAGVSARGVGVWGWLAPARAPEPTVVSDPGERRALVVEVVLVLAVTLGLSGVRSLLALLD